MTLKPCACSWLTVASTGDGPDGAAVALPASPSAAEANAPAARVVTKIFFIFVPFFKCWKLLCWFGCRWFKRPSRSVHQSALVANSLLMLRIRLSSKAQHSSRRTRRLSTGDYVVDRATPRACGSWFAAELSCCVSVGRFSYVASLVQRSGRRSGSPCLAPPRFFLIRQSYAVSSCPS